MEQLKAKLRKYVPKEQAEIIDSLNDLSKAELIEVIGVFTEIRKKRFRRTKRKLGELSKALTDQMFQELLDNEKDEKYRLAYTVQGLLALRVSEVTNLKVEDIDFNKKCIYINNRKVDRVDVLPLPYELEQPLFLWISKNKAIIHQKEGYIFFSSFKDRKQISDNNLRNRIRGMFNEISNKEYGESCDGRKLNLYSSHSLRAYGISRFYEISGYDSELTRQFARHSNMKDTVLYLRKDYNKMTQLLRTPHTGIYLNNDSNIKGYEVSR